MEGMKKMYCIDDKVGMGKDRSLTIKLNKCVGKCWSDRKKMRFMKGKVFKIFGTKTFIDLDSDSLMTTKVVNLAQFTMKKDIKMG